MLCSSASRASAPSISFWSAGISPYCSSAARFRSPVRVARSASTLSSSSRSFISRMPPIASFSDCHCAFIPELFSFSSAISASSRCSRSRDSGSCSFRSALRSISSWISRRSTSSISCGSESISMRSRLAASSIRSIALSGRKRSPM